MTRAPAKLRLCHEARFILGVMDASFFPPDPFPYVLVAGRSNSGKSSLLNALTGQKALARVSKTPGRTTEINFFLCDERWFLVDLPGYGYAAQSRSKRADWAAPINALFSDERTCLILLLADCRREPEREEDQIFEMAQYHHVPVQIVLTKRDKIGRAEFNKVSSRWSGSDFPAALPLFTSVEKRVGIEELSAVILNHVASAQSELARTASRTLEMQPGKEPEHA
jgi:GTP-binding protein